MDQPSGALLMVSVDIDPANAADLENWYEEEHFPEKLAEPGYRGARLYRHHDDTANRARVNRIERGNERGELPAIRIGVDDESSSGRFHHVAQRRVIRPADDQHLFDCRSAEAANQSCGKRRPCWFNRQQRLRAPEPAGSACRQDHPGRHA